MIGPDEIARGRRAEPCRAVAASAWRSRLSTNGRPGSTSRRLSAGRQQQSDAGADRWPSRRLVVERRAAARGDTARSDRPHRNSARAGGEPVRRGRDRRRDPDLHPQRAHRAAFAGNASAGYGTYARVSSSGGVVGNVAARGASRYRAGNGRARASTPSAIRPTSATTPTATATATTARTRASSYDFAPEQELSVQYLKQPAECPVRRRSRLRRPHHHDASSPTRWRVATASPRSGRARSKPAAARDDSASQTGFGPSRFNTLQRQYTWQNDFTLPLGGLSVAAVRREERARHRRRLCGDLAQHQRARRRLPVARRVRRRCRRICATTRVRSTAARPRARSPMATRSCRRLRASASYGTGLQGADLQRPLLSRAFPIPISCRRRRATSRRRCATPAREFDAGIVAYRNRVRDLIVFECDAQFNCAPQNVANATLEGVTLEFERRFREHRAQGERSILQRPHDDATGNLLPRRARALRRARRSRRRSVRCSSACSWRHARCATTTPPTRGGWAATRS